MGFFQKMKNGLARFMYGRNGADQLSLALIVGSLALDVISMLIIGRMQMVGTFIYWAAMVMWVWTIFRMFSKNLYKRREENGRWMAFVWKIKNGRAGAKARRADKEHKYFTCKSCKTICRVPVGKGMIEITCPKCGAKRRVKT